jgi:hypothetical protein
MTLDKIIIINRKDQSFIDNNFFKYKAIIIIPIKDIELSQHSNNKLRKILTKLLLEPKKKNFFY